MSDIARVYPPGTEPAKGGQTGGTPEVNGKERAKPDILNLAHNYGDIAK